MLMFWIALGLTGAWSLLMIWPFEWGDHSDIPAVLLFNLPWWITLPPYAVIWACCGVTWWLLHA